MRHGHVIGSLLGCLLAIGSILPSTAQAAAQRSVDALLATQDPIHVTVDGEPVIFDVPPVIVEGRTFVEVNGLFERLNISVSWNPQFGRVTGISAVNGNRIDLDMGVGFGRVNGQSFLLDAPPFIATEYGRAMVPLAFVAEHAASEVRWVQESRTAVVRKIGLAARDHVILSAWQLAHHTYQGYAQYEQDGPISITPGQVVTNNVAFEDIHLVSLSGTDMVRADGQATGWWTNLVVGYFNAPNDYLTAVRNRIAWHVPAGSTLVLSGHSQGGMIAQQVAADPWIRANYTVRNTITFGSPKTGGTQREGVVRRLGDWIDPVPYASLEQGTIGRNVFGLIREQSGIINPIHAHNQSYLREDVWGHYDALGTRFGSAVLVIKPGLTRFYPAPDL